MSYDVKTESDEPREPPPERGKATDDGWGDLLRRPDVAPVDTTDRSRSEPVDPVTTVESPGHLPADVAPETSAVPVDRSKPAEDRIVHPAPVLEAPRDVAGQVSWRLRMAAEVADRGIDVAKAVVGSILDGIPKAAGVRDLVDHSLDLAPAAIRAVADRLAAVSFRDDKERFDATDETIIAAWGRWNDVHDDLSRERRAVVPSQPNGRHDEAHRPARYDPYKDPQVDRDRLVVNDRARGELGEVHKTLTDLATKRNDLISARFLDSAPDGRGTPMAANEQLRRDGQLLIRRLDDLQRDLWGRLASDRDR